MAEHGDCGLYIHGILLAAGESKRFGGIKQLAVLKASHLSHVIKDLSHDKAMISHTSEQIAKADFAEKTVILGANAQQIALLLDDGVKYKKAAHWKLGMGASIAQAVQELSDSTSHVALLLADQICLSSEDYNVLINCAKQSPDKIIAAKYEGDLGAPCIFPSSYFPLLADLNADIGARKILLDHSEQVLEVDLPLAAIDIDRPEDLLKQESL